MPDIWNEILKTAEVTHREWETPKKLKERKDQ